MAIKALTSQLERQLVESTISFDPLIDSGGHGSPAQLSTPGGKCRGPAEGQHQLATVAGMRRTRYFVMSILSR